ncbi:hypothetical protein [Nocardia gipuzkoensis]
MSVDEDDEARSARIRAEADEWVSSLYLSPALGRTLLATGAFGSWW